MHLLVNVIWVVCLFIFFGDLFFFLTNRRETHNSSVFACLRVVRIVYMPALQAWHAAFWAFLNAVKTKTGCVKTNGSFCMQACASFSRLSGIILIFSVNPSVQRHMQTTHSLPGWFISQQIPSEKPGPHQMFGKGCCFETTVNFSLNRLHTGLDLTLLLLFFSRLISYYRPSSIPHKFCFTLAGY